MKKLLALMLALMLLGTSALAQDGGYRFSQDELGFRFIIDESWKYVVDDRDLSFFCRVDDGVATSTLSGYGLIYATPNLSGEQRTFETFDEMETWLNGEMIALGGVVTHAPDADLSAIYPDYERLPLGAVGATAFTAIRPKALDLSSLDPELARVAGEVYQALAKPESYQFFDVKQDYGALGAFETTSLDGAVVNQDFVGNAPLTLVYFWGTYCSPCLESIGNLSQVIESYKDKGVQGLGIVVDAYDDETKDVAREIVDRTQVTFVNIPPMLSTAALMNGQYTPTYMFLDAKGQKVGEDIVGPLSKDNLRAELDARLAMIP
ncbi:MAG: TlpA disulfide reductase family protein [Clostridia bacterium]